MKTPHSELQVYELRVQVYASIKDMPYSTSSMFNNKAT